MWQWRGMLGVVGSVYRLPALGNHHSSCTHMLQHPSIQRSLPSSPTHANTYTHTFTLHTTSEPHPPCGFWPHTEVTTLGVAGHHTPMRSVAVRAVVLAVPMYEACKPVSVCVCVTVVLAIPMEQDCTCVCVCVRESVRVCACSSVIRPSRCVQCGLDSTRILLGRAQDTAHTCIYPAT